MSSHVPRFAYFGLPLGALALMRAGRDREDLDVLPRPPERAVPVEVAEAEVELPPRRLADDLEAAGIKVSRSPARIGATLAEVLKG